VVKSPQDSAFEAAGWAAAGADAADGDAALVEPFCPVSPNDSRSMPATGFDGDGVVAAFGGAGNLMPPGGGGKTPPVPPVPRVRGLLVASLPSFFCNHRRSESTMRSFKFKIPRIHSEEHKL